jgi:hypothetical protein
MNARRILILVLVLLLLLLFGSQYYFRNRDRKEPEKIVEPAPEPAPKPEPLPPAETAKLPPLPEPEKAPVPAPLVPIPKPTPSTAPESRPLKRSVESYLGFPKIQEAAFSVQSGVNVDYYIPASANYDPSWGAGLVCDISFRFDHIFSLSLDVFDLRNTEDPAVHTVVPMARGNYLKYFGDFFIGGGGGVGMSISDLEENTTFTFAEIKCGYRFRNMDRVFLRYYIPFNTDDNTGTVVLGYEFLF